ncbi:MAG: type II toxin-antitoxin system HipA family toxin [Bacteroidota bacterium]
MISIADVKIWNKKVGAIAYDTDKGEAAFEFENSFLSTNLNLSPFKMPLLQAKGKIFVFPELKRSHTFKGMPGLLADVLPDKYGNALINAWLSRNGRQAGSLNPVEMLCFIGKRGMGALEFSPVVPKVTATSTQLIIGDLVQVAENILSDRQNFSTNLSKDDERALTDILKIGTSAGGARAKAIIAYNPLTKEVRSGQTAANTGFQHWLIKFDGVQDIQFGSSSGYGRVEMAYYNMARDCGIEMMESRLLEENGRAHFMTRRFDRPNEKDKLHVQTFCALMHYDFNEVGMFSYEQLFALMRSLQLPYPQQEQLYRRMVFNVLARNCDDHTKNFAFTMNQNGVWKLSPAYDVCHAYRPGSAWVSMHSLTINGKRQNLSRADLLEVASNMNIKKAKHIIDQINEVVKNWSNYAEQQKVAAVLRDTIGNTLLNVSLS